MFGKSKKPNMNAVNSIIAAGTSFEGCITFSGAMKILGKVNGDVFDEDTTGTPVSMVIVEGTLDGGTIEADHIVVTGSVCVKKVVAKISLTIISGGKVISDEIFYKSISSDETAIINGKLERIQDPSPN